MVVNMQGELNGKVAIVTGGARGIGKGIVKKYIQEGAQVIIADILENGQLLEEELGEQCHFYKIDLTKKKDIFEMVDQIYEQYGKIDILVNCAGVAKPVPTLKLSEELLDMRSEERRVGKEDRYRWSR